MPRALVCGAAIGFALTVSTVAQAQLRWDIGARIGAGKRALSSQPEGVRDGNAGPVGELTLHTALLPLLRVGPAFSMEVSPVAGRPTRRHYGAGLEARLYAPLALPNLRPFAYVGVRGVLVRQPDTDAHAGGGGAYLSIPFGIGLSAAVVKYVRFVATFGGDGAILHGGGLYDAKNAAYLGNDVAAIRGMVGADFEF